VSRERVGRAAVELVGQVASERRLLVEGEEIWSRSCMSQRICHWSTWRAIIAPLGGSVAILRGESVVGRG